jgi:hypothetical protein
MLDNSLELLLKQADEQEFDDDSSCARCRIYQRKKENDSQLLKKLKHIHQIHAEHNYFTTYLQYSSSGFYFFLIPYLIYLSFLHLESDLILSLSKTADHIGHSSNLNVSNHTKKLPTSTIKKKQQLPKLQSSMSLIVGDSNKTNKRTIEESRTISNSNFISTNYDLTNKRHKRIGRFIIEIHISSFLSSVTYLVGDASYP